MNVYGSSNSGKTNLILNFIGFYKKIFKDRIIVLTCSTNGSFVLVGKELSSENIQQFN